MIICFGPCCVPVSMLFPFLLGVLHRYGYFEWFKQEWVTFNYWKKYFWNGNETNVSKNSKACDDTDTNGITEAGEEGAVDCCGCDAKDKNNNVQSESTQDDVKEEKKTI